MKITGFLEVVGAQHEVQFLVERIAQQLQFLAQLPLVHGEAELEEIERRTVGIKTGIPVHFAIGGDRFERDAVSQVEVDHSSKPPGLKVRIAVAAGIAGIGIGN